MTSAISAANLQRPRSSSTFSRSAESYFLVVCGFDSSGFPDLVLAVLDRYEREFVTPYVNVPLGGLDTGRISALTAKAYRSYIRRWIRPGQVPDHRIQQAPAAVLN